MKKKSLLITAIAIFGFATISMAQVPSYVPTNGLVGWWPFNGNANDESGNGNNGTILGAITAVDRFGVGNAAYEIDGIDCPSQKGITTPNIINNSMPFSVSIWFQSTDTTKFFQTILNSAPHNYISLSLNYNGTIPICSWIGDGSNWIINGTSNTWGINNQNYWNNLIMVKIDSLVNYYINGSLAHSQYTTSNLNTGTFNFCFGSITQSGPVYCYEVFKGMLDDIGIWNRALTQQEISNLYNGCQLSVNIQPTNQTININNNAQFVVGSSNPNANYQWQTDLGVGFQNLNSVGQYSGTTTTTLSVSNVTTSNNNQPFRCIVSSGSCSDTSNIAVLTVNNNVGINETSQDNLFSVFPNPAQDIIHVKADAKLIGELYSIYNNTGRVVLSGKINSENTTIELGNLSGGIYMFSVGENMKQTFKVIKE